MRAMILAAGLGTRLKPLTNDRPKALVEINGKTLLEITLRRLAAFDIHDVIVNVHHFADLVIDYLQDNRNFGMHVEISREDQLLDTGGGLKKASWFFQEDAVRTEPFLLHNVDVISSIDFGWMLQAHKENRALATLAVQERKTSRYLLFDEKNQLCGRRNADASSEERVRPSQQTHAYAFSGIHVISPRMLSMIDEAGAFSIVTTYLRLAGREECISGLRTDQFYWRDVGTPESVAAADAAHHTAALGKAITSTEN